MKALIIGGAGFIGCNIAARLIDEGNEVLIFDNLSRRGTHANLRWLKKIRGPFQQLRGDVRNYSDLISVFSRHPDIDVVYHMAGQVAVTSSVSNPREDFEINALGTFNVLEAIRLARINPILLFASTNKVYGGMTDLNVIEQDGRYAHPDFPEGQREDRPLDFHSPYGCSKGAADQYVRDYARIYGLRTVIFRQSCIYGYRQFATQRQGWVAWFTRCAFLNHSVSIFGDGKQVRDMLFVDDLVDAYQLAVRNIEITAGQIYNVGGGPKYTMSINELIAFLEDLTQRKLRVTYRGWRPGDQLVFVSNTDKAKRDFGWSPRISSEEGVRELFEWVKRSTRSFRRR